MAADQASYYCCSYFNVSTRSFQVLFRYLISRLGRADMEEIRCRDWIILGMYALNPSGGGIRVDFSPSCGIIFNVHASLAVFEERKCDDYHAVHSALEIQSKANFCNGLGICND